MAIDRRRHLLELERLETRSLLSASHATHFITSNQAVTSHATSDPTAQSGNTIVILEGFAEAYLSRVGDQNYNPAYDLDHNRQIGQGDGRLLLRSLPPVGKRIPLTLTVGLSPEDKARGAVPQHSGGVTHSQNPTILGRTTPGALIFTGSGTLDLKLRGPVIVADAHGNFSFVDHLTNGINQLDFQAVDPYGHQILRAFPIYWLDFGKTR